MTRTICLILGLGMLSGCGVTKGLFTGTGPEFDGQRFRGSAKALERGDPKRFVATVRPASASVSGAIAAAEYEAIGHCIHYYGTSDIDWEVGPDTAPEAFAIDNDQLSLRGACVDPARP